MAGDVGARLDVEGEAAGEEPFISFGILDLAPGLPPDPPPHDPPGLAVFFIPSSQTAIYGTKS